MARLTHSRSIACRLAGGMVALVLLGGLVAPASADDPGESRRGGGNLNALLNGDYAFSGSSSCLVSRGGFNADLTPAGPPAPFPFMITFSVQGVRTFNGDGTGHGVGRVLSLSQPFALPTTPPFFNRGGVNGIDIETDFTYDVAPDGTFTLQTSSLIGHADNGSTQTFTNFPAFLGAMSQDRRTLTMQHQEPTVETATIVQPDGGTDVQPRICHRVRILIKLGR